MSKKTPDATLEIDSLHVQIGSRMILQDISLSIRPSEIVGIIGPNGCGKTTLLNAISGFLPITSGTISVNGKDVMGLPAHARVGLGIARGFQHVGVFREMTVEENLMTAIERAEKYPWWWMLSRGYRRRMAVSIDAALAEVGLESHKKSLAGILSGGQLRLLELVRLKLAPGNLLLIDEPTAGVAPILRDSLSEIIKDLSQNHGRTVVIIEHDLKFLFDLVDRVIVLVDGQKYLEGTPKDVRQDERLQKIYFGS